VVSVPVYTSFARGLPIVSQINRNRLFVLTAFCGAVLAAYGLHHLLELEGRARRRLLLTVAAVATLAPLLWLAQHSDVLSSWQLALDQLPNTQREPLTRPVLQLAAFMRWGLFAGLGLILVALAVRRPRLRPALAVALVAVAAFDLVSFQRGMHPATPIAWADPPELPLVRTIHELAGHERTGGMIEMMPNLSERFRIRDARKYESPPLHRRYLLWHELGGEGSDQMILPPTATRAADLFSVRWMISYHLAEHETPQFHIVAPPIVENRFALPRAWMAYEWRPASGEKDALAKVVKGTDPDAFRAPVIEGVAPSPAGPAPKPHAVQFLTDGERGTRMVMDARRPGRLVLNDTWYPGWKATVDGRDTPIRHANVAFRAVEVPAGHHVVTFTYQPASVRIGVALSAVAAALIALLLISPSGIPGYRSRRPGSPATSAGGRP
jgi:hypothetical protein